MENTRLPPPPKEHLHAFSQISVARNTLNDQPAVTIYFRNACNELSKIAQEYGYKVSSTNQRGLEKFESLLPEQKLQITSILQTYVQQIRSARFDKINIVDDNRKHAWWAMGKMGLRAPPNLFEKIKSTDIIEIYNKDSIQVFRSFEMFKYLSYSLSEIFSYDWVELYSRDEFVFRRMFNLVQDVLDGKIIGIINTNFPSHIVEEKFSDKKCWAKMEHVLVSALYTSEGHIDGLISTFRILDSGSI